MRFFVFVLLADDEPKTEKFSQYKNNIYLGKTFIVRQ